MLVDITGRERSENADERMSAIVESSDDAIISNNLEGIEGRRAELDGTAVVGRMIHDRPRGKVRMEWCAPGLVCEIAFLRFVTRRREQ